MTAWDASALLAHLWQSTWFVAGVWLATWTLRNNRARVRYWLWAIASVKFLVPFSALVALGSPFEWHTTASVIAQPAATFVADNVFSSVIFEVPASVPGDQGSARLSPLLSAVWVLGIGGVFFWWWRQWLRVLRAMSRATPTTLGPDYDTSGFAVMSSPVAVEPGVIGVWRPVLLLPDGLVDRLTVAQLRALIAHERCHVRNQDNLTAIFHMVVSAIFWFHPLVWWIERRMIAERERACDEAVLGSGNDASEYAEGILEVCRASMPPSLTCVAGIRGGDLRHRIESIMRRDIGRPMTPLRRLALALAMVGVVALPMLVGAVTAQTWVAHITIPSPKVSALPLAFTAAHPVDQSLSRDAQGPRAPSDTRPRFEVASIRRCEEAPGRGGGPGNSSPGRVLINCQIVRGLIQAAYLAFADGKTNRGALVIRTPVEGGPSWIDSEAYTIEATAPGEPTRPMMMGPMLQTLLEDRFQLKLRRAAREIPVYALTVPSAGHKLKPFVEGSCVVRELDPNQPNPMAARANLPPLAPGQRECMNRGMLRGEARVIEADQVTMNELTDFFIGIVDRPVIDRTGLTGKWGVHLEFAPTDRDRQLRSDTAEPAAPSIFTAIGEQLGLRLEPARGAQEHLIVESIERPTEN